MNTTPLIYPIEKSCCNFKPKRAAPLLDTISISDGRVRQLFSSPDKIGRPVWLPGGETLLLPHYEPRYHRMQLWTISFTTGEARRFTNDLTQYSSTLDATHDGRTLAAVVGTEVSNVWIVPGADPTKGQQITSNGPPLFDVAEKVDGKLLAASGDGELWSMNSDGSQRAVFGELHDGGWPTPCGHFVALLSYDTSLALLC
jgi:hypothetical protein